MKCQKCNKNEATTHYTQIINGKKTEYYLCEDFPDEKFCSEECLIEYLISMGYLKEEE